MKRLDHTSCPDVVGLRDGHNHEHAVALVLRFVEPLHFIFDAVFQANRHPIDVGRRRGLIDAHAFRVLT